MIRLGDNPATATFSSIGDQNRALFFVWGITTGLATLLNIRLLASRLNFKNRIFDWVSSTGCAMALVTVTVLGYDPVNRTIHIISAAIFGITCVACLLLLMIIKLIKRSKTAVPYITAMALAGVIFIFTSIYIGWFTALTQILLANVCLVVMFSSNFIEKMPSYSQEKGT